MFHSRPWVHATKVALGNAFCMLFTLVPSMHYPSSGLICTLYIIAATLVADTPHIGSNMAAAFVLVWSGIYGSVLAAFVLLIHVGNVGIVLLSCFVIFPPFVLLRFSPNPKMSTLSNLTLIVYGINVMSFQSADDQTVKLSIGYSILSSIIAASTEIVFCLIVKPLWAGNDMRHQCRKLCRGLGKVISTVASNIVVLDSDRCKIADINVFDDEMLRSIHSGKPMLDHNLGGNGNPPITSDPNAALRPVQWGTVTPLFVQSLWHYVHLCQELIGALRAEATLLNPLTAVPLSEWTHLFDKLSKCIVQVSALQTVIVQSSRRFSDQTLMRFWSSALPDIKYDLAIMAASLRAAEGCFSSPRIPSEGLAHPDLDGEQADQRRHTVLAEVLQGFRRYWRVVLTGSEESPSEEVRALLYTGVLRRGVGKSITALQGAIFALSRTTYPKTYSLSGLFFNAKVWKDLTFTPYILWWHQLRNSNKLLTFHFWSWFLKDHPAIHSFKLYVMMSLLITCLFLVPNAALAQLSSNNFGTVFASLIVVMQPSLESTVQRFIFRALGSMAGTALGFAIVHWQTAAQSVPLLLLYMVLLFLPVLQLYESPYRFAVFCFCLSLTLEILGQYPNDSPDIHAALRRVTAIVLGCGVAMIGSLVVPFSASAEIRTIVGSLVHASASMMNWYVDQYIAFGDRIRERKSEGCDVCLTKEISNSAPWQIVRDINIPLNHMRLKIDKDILAWQCGALSDRHEFKRMEEGLQMESLRLAAMDEILRRTPVLLGSYGDPQRGSVPHVMIMAPLHNEIAAVQGAVASIDASIAQCLHNPKTCEEALQAACRTLVNSRATMLSKFARLRAAMHAEARLDPPALLLDGAVDSNSLHPHDFPVNPDDAVLYLSFYFAWIGAINALLHIAEVISAQHYAASLVEISSV